MRVQSNPVNGSPDNGSILLLVQIQAGPERNDKLLCKKIWLKVQYNPHNGSILDDIWVILMF